MKTATPRRGFALAQLPAWPMGTTYNSELLIADLTAFINSHTSSGADNAQQLVCFLENSSSISSLLD
jgi:hypothetical protein